MRALIPPRRRQPGNVLIAKLEVIAHTAVDPVGGGNLRRQATPSDERAVHRRRVEATLTQFSLGTDRWRTSVRDRSLARGERMDLIPE
jgi:hypothetical protein